MKIKLYTPFYNDSAADRHLENLTCLQNNVTNTLIDEVVLFVDDPEPYLKFAGSKVHLVTTKEPRPTYQDFLDHAQLEKEECLVIMANTDIYFDSTLEHLQGIDWTNLLVCLTRRDVMNDGRSALSEHYQSSDAWIIKAPCKPFDCPIKLGRMHCESTFLAIAQNAGYKLVNGGLTVAAQHLHRTQKRNYDPSVDKYSDTFLMAYPILGSLGSLKPSIRQPKNDQLIAIDGSVFRSESTGIAKVLAHLLLYWSNTDFAEKIVLLDRGYSAPTIPGIRSYPAPQYNSNFTVASGRILRHICEDLGASKFMSASFTRPFGTPFVELVSDTMLEAMNGDLEGFRARAYTILDAFAVVTFNHQVKSHLVDFFSDSISGKIVVLPPPVAESFSPAKDSEMQFFKTKYKIDRPYFLMVGDRSSLCSGVNGSLVFKSMQRLQQAQSTLLFCVGGSSPLEPSLLELFNPELVRHEFLPDHELSCAYSGALGLIYAKRSDHSCLQIIEAMKCGCPVISSPLPSVVEATRNCALFYQHNEPDSLLRAMCEAMDPQIHKKISEASLNVAKGYSLKVTAEAVRLLLESLPA